MIVLVIGILVILGFYFLQQKSYRGIVIGLILLGNGINLSIFVGAEPTVGQYAFLEVGQGTPESNDPLPQALVLTAIVIGFALTGFVIALVKSMMNLNPGSRELVLAEEDADE